MTRGVLADCTTCRNPSFPSSVRYQWLRSAAGMPPSGDAVTYRA